MENNITKVYQIIASGERIGGGRTSYHSKKVYTGNPSKIEILSFIDKCTSSKCHELDLEKKSVEINIIELDVF